jgi:hypothetical protein
MVARVGLPGGGLWKGRRSRFVNLLLGVLVVTVGR